MGADLIIINPTDVDALADAIMEAHNAGCKIYINGATSDSLSEEYYECCTVSDEYLCGAYIAMIAKNWIEAHADELNAANPDWEIAFIESSLADETLKRTYGLESIINPYLTDWEGNYVDVSGNIVDGQTRSRTPLTAQSLPSTTRVQRLSRTRPTAAATSATSSPPTPTHAYSFATTLWHPFRAVSTLLTTTAT